MKAKILPLFIGAALLPGLVVADHWGRQYRDEMFLTLDAGEAKQDIDESDFNNPTIDDTDTAFRIGIGGRSGLLGGGLSYINLGQTSVETATDSAEAETDGAAFDLSLDLPLAQDVAFFVKGGLFVWEQETVERSVGSTFVSRFHEEGTDPFWGVGLRISSVPGFNLKFEFNRFEFKDDSNNVVADYDLTTLGIEFLL